MKALMILEDCLINLNQKRLMRAFLVEEITTLNI